MQKYVRVLTYCFAQLNQFRRPFIVIGVDFADANQIDSIAAIVGIVDLDDATTLKV